MNWSFTGYHPVILQLVYFTYFTALLLKYALKLFKILFLLLLLPLSLTKLNDYFIISLCPPPVQNKLSMSIIYCPVLGIIGVLFFLFENKGFSSACSFTFDYWFRRFKHIFSLFISVQLFSYFTFIDENTVFTTLTSSLKFIDDSTMCYYRGSVFQWIFSWSIGVEKYIFHHYCNKLLIRVFMSSAFFFNELDFTLLINY